MFLSKKYPLLFVVKPLDKSIAETKFMFKQGDDLRQDSLVLQMFKFMDLIWIENGLNLEMVTYDVMETGHKLGYIEFVGNSTVVSKMHLHSGFFFGTYKENSIL
jgi:hypothetical protein